MARFWGLVSIQGFKAQDLVFGVPFQTSGSTDADALDALARMTPLNLYQGLDIFPYKTCKRREIPKQRRS